MPRVLDRLPPVSVPRPLRAVRHAARVPELWRCVRMSADWRALIGGYLGAWPLCYPHEFRTRSGDVLTLADFHDLVTAWIIYFRREYEVPRDCRTIVDAGANIGAFSLYAARGAPEAHIIALEPFPSTRARLEEHVKRNGLDERVACRPWALAAADGSRHMDDSAGPSQSRGLHAAEADAGGMPVEAITLATLWEREQLGQVDLLKLDIEGGEHELLCATPAEVLRRASAIALEYHPNGSREALFACLKTAGFTLARDVEHSPNSGVAHFRLERTT